MVYTLPEKPKYPPHFRKGDHRRNCEWCSHMKPRISAVDRENCTTTNCDDMVCPFHTVDKTNPLVVSRDMVCEDYQ